MILTGDINGETAFFGVIFSVPNEFLGLEAFEVDCDRDLREKEVGIIEKLERISEKNGFQSLNTDWFLGYPYCGSGAPAGRYGREPTNLIQFATSDTFPMVNVSRYANLFYSNNDFKSTYFFDWTGSF